MRVGLVLGCVLAVSGTARAQWDIQSSGTTESLRGISSAGAGVAWASGTHGTVRRTEDGGYLWQRCAVPPGAEELDFRGVVGFDANTAVVMSSGKGALSRLYKTTDGCSNWKLLYTNPDEDGFWDAISAADEKSLIILGDPVDGMFVVRASADGGETWTPERVDVSLDKEGAFAASNSSLVVGWAEDFAFFGSGSPGGARLFADCDSCDGKDKGWTARAMPMFAKGESAGIFSIGYGETNRLVAVGGDYQKPDAARGNAAWSTDGGKSWHAAKTSPHGYRSSVAYEAKERMWIAVGSSGTDVSRDGGVTWRAAKPLPGEAADADKNWNAIALPFVVGPKGRVGVWAGVQR
jgi:photosystem II stability/assembly factor-like uncharacterized protein